MRYLLFLLFFAFTADAQTDWPIENGTAAQVYVDTVSEASSGVGVTVDGVLLKDNAVNTDTINEKTATAGVTIDGVKLKDNDVQADAVTDAAGTGAFDAPNGMSISNEAFDQYDENTPTSFLGSFVAPPGGDATVTFSRLDFTEIGNFVIFTGRVLIGSSGNTDDIIQTGNGVLPSPAQDQWYFVVQNSNGFRIRVNTNGNVLIYKVSPTNLLTGVLWNTSEGLTFTGVYIP